MKKILLTAIAAVIAFGLMACSAPAEETVSAATQTPADAPTDVQTQAPEATLAATPEPEDIAMESPAQLFEATYNPLSDKQWPEGYTVYQVGVESGEYDLFRLYLTAEDTAENVVAFCSELIGDDAPDSIQQSHDLLDRDGFVGINKGSGMSVEIAPTDEDDDDYTYVDGYTVCVVVGIDEDSFYDYQSALDTCFNEKVIAALAAYIDIENPQGRDLCVNRKNQRVHATWMYVPEDYEAACQGIAGDAIWTGSNGHEMSFAYGDLNVAMYFNDETKAVFLDQCLDDLSINIADYKAEATLENLGFTLYDTKCGYEDEDMWMAVSKNEWGDEENIINFAFEIFGQPCRVIVSYPDQIYTVMIGEDEQSIDYSYDAFANTVTPTASFADYDAFKAAFEALTGETSDSSVAEPVMFVDHYTEDTFGYEPERLFELPRE